MLCYHLDAMNFINIILPDNILQKRNTIFVNVL